MPGEAERTTESAVIDTIERTVVDQIPVTVYEEITRIVNDTIEETKYEIVNHNSTNDSGDGINSDPNAISQSAIESMSRVDTHEHNSSDSDDLSCHYGYCEPAHHGYGHKKHHGYGYGKHHYSV